MAAVIRAEHLEKRYGDVVAVDDLTLEIQPGEVFGLLGPNGAGKTTTILMLLGLTEPTGGKVEVLGLDPRFHSLEIKARVGYLPDNVGFYEPMTGRENLRYTTRLNRIPGYEARDRIDAALELTRLAGVADQRVSSYSRGMRQRLGLADALVKDPSILILDEPTVNIDPAGVEEVLALVQRLAEQEGVAVLLSSHLLHQVQVVCDRMGIFVAGRMVTEGTLEDLASELDHLVTIELQATGDTARQREVIDAVAGVTSVVRSGDMWEVAAGLDVRAELSDALHDAGCPVVYMRRTGAQLDAIYRRYFTEDATQRVDR